MRSIAANSFILLVTCCALSLAAPAMATPVSSTIVTDPVFGLEFDADKAGFQKLKTLGRDCPTIARSDQWDRESWLFARASDAKGELLVLGGRLVPRHGKPMSDSVGAIVRLSPAGCELIGPATEPFENPEAYSSTISTHELDALAKDAAVRFTKALGGRDKLIDLARKQHVTLQPPSKPALMHAMEHPL